MERLAERGVKQIVLYATEEDVGRWDEIARRRGMTRSAWLIRTIDQSEQRESALEAERTDLRKQVEDEKHLRSEWQERGMQAELQVLQMSREIYSMRSQLTRIEEEKRGLEIEINLRESEAPRVDTGKIVRMSQAAARSFARTVAKAEKKASAKRGGK
jgi:hypothetical protein